MNETYEDPDNLAPSPVVAVVFALSLLIACALVFALIVAVM